MGQTSLILRNPRHTALIPWVEPQTIFGFPPSQPPEQSPSEKHRQRLKVFLPDDKHSLLDWPQPLGTTAPIPCDQLAKAILMDQIMLGAILDSKTNDDFGYRCKDYTIRTFQQLIRLAQTHDKNMARAYLEYFYQGPLDLIKGAAKKRYQDDPKGMQRVFHDLLAHDWCFFESLREPGQFDIVIDILKKNKDPLTSTADLVSERVRLVIFRPALEALKMGISLQMRKIPPRLRLTSDVDLNIFARILNLIVDNAVHYADPKKEGKRKIAIFWNNRLNGLSICDNGIGIKNIKAVLQGHREEDRHHQPGHGSGLGSVQGLLQKMGWTFELRSEPDKFTCVTLIPKAGDVHEAAFK